MNLNENWNGLWKNITSKKEYTELLEYITEEKENFQDILDILPPDDKIFHAFDLVSPQDLKVVIIGQDPYHGKGQAMGLSFSVPDGIKIPPSLRNIFLNIEKYHKKEYPINGNLERWANQGVLLLNTALTVLEGKPSRHALKWKFFSKEVIQWINNNQENIVFILWGNHAKNFKKLIDSSKHFIIEGVHPSPLSKRGQGEHPFLETDYFGIANEYLKKNSKDEIDW